MKKFMVNYHSPQGAEEEMMGNPQDMKKMMEDWMKWKEDCDGAVVEFGTPLASGMSITKSGVEKSNQTVSGYSIMEAESMDAVIEMLKKHPHLNMPGGGCEIEVYESMSTPGM